MSPLITRMTTNSGSERREMEAAPTNHAALFKLEREFNRKYTRMFYRACMALEDCPAPMKKRILDLRFAMVELRIRHLTRLLDIIGIAD